MPRHTRFYRSRSITDPYQPPPPLARVASNDPFLRAVRSAASDGVGTPQLLTVVVDLASRRETRVAGNSGGREMGWMDVGVQATDPEAAAQRRDQWKATDPSMVVNVALSPGSVYAWIDGSRNTNRYP